jgi:hypothetical protein
MVEFSDGVSCSESLKAQNMFYPLAVYSYIKGLAVVHIFIQFPNRH